MKNVLDLGYHNMGCIEGMKQFPDNYFALAVVDPPYFDGPNKRNYYGTEISKRNIKRKEYQKIEVWEVPHKEYFDELFRVSKNQIIWGVNYYNDPRLKGGRIIWDKVNGTNSFSDAEIAYCSIHDSVRIFPFMWNGMLQGKSMSEGRTAQGNKSKNEHRIHQCQKPVAIYEWILKNYAKEGDKILDTHVGSASSLIACHKGGFEYVGFELDKGIFEQSQKRLELEESQMRLF